MFPSSTSLPISSVFPINPEEQAFQELYDFLDTHKAILRQHQALSPDFFERDPSDVEKALRRFQKESKSIQHKHKNINGVYQDLTPFLSLKLAYSQALIPMCVSEFSPDGRPLTKTPLAAKVQNALGKQLGRALSRSKLALQDKICGLFCAYKREAARTNDLELLEEEEFTKKLIEVLQEGFQAVAEVMTFLEERLSKKRRSHMHVVPTNHLHPWETLTEFLDAVAPLWWLRHVVKHYGLSKVQVFLPETDALHYLPRPAQQHLLDALVSTLSEEQAKLYNDWETAHAKGDDYFPFAPEPSFPHAYSFPGSEDSPPYRRGIRTGKVQEHTFERFDMFPAAKITALKPFVTHKSDAMTQSLHKKTFFGKILEYVYILGAPLLQHQDFPKLLWDRERMDPFHTRHLLRYIRVYESFPSLVSESPEALVVELLYREFAHAAIAAQSDEDLQEELCKEVTCTTPHTDLECLSKAMAIKWQSLVQDLRQKLFEHLASLCDHKILREAIAQHNAKGLAQLPLRSHEQWNFLWSPWTTRGEAFYNLKALQEYPKTLKALWHKRRQPFTYNMSMLFRRCLHEDHQWLGELPQERLETLVHKSLQEFSQNEQLPLHQRLMSPFPREIHHYINPELSFSLWFDRSFSMAWNEISPYWTDAHTQVLCARLDDIEEGLYEELAPHLDEITDIEELDTKCRTDTCASARRKLNDGLDCLRRFPKALDAWIHERDARIPAFFHPEDLAEKIVEGADFLRYFPEIRLSRDSKVFACLYMNFALSKREYLLSDRKLEESLDWIPWQVLLYKLPASWAADMLQTYLRHAPIELKAPCALYVFEASNRPHDQMPNSLAQVAEALFTTPVLQGALYIRTMHALWAKAQLNACTETLQLDEQQLQLEALWDRLNGLGLNAAALEEAELTDPLYSVLTGSPVLNWKQPDDPPKANAFFIELLHFGLRKEETLHLAQVHRREEKRLPALLERAIQQWLLGRNTEFVYAAKYLLQGPLLDGAKTIVADNKQHEPLATMLVAVVDEIFQMHDGQWPFSDDIAPLDEDECALLLMILRELGTSKSERVLGHIRKRAEKKRNQGRIDWIDGILGENRALMKRSRYQKLPRKRLHHLLAIGGFLASKRQHQKPAYADQKVVRELLSEVTQESQ